MLSVSTFVMANELRDKGIEIANDAVAADQGTPLPSAASPAIAPAASRCSGGSSAALLLMEVWTRDTPLREILQRIADHTGPVDGAALLAMVAEDTGLDRAAFLQAARALGHAEPSPRASIDPDGWDLGV